MSEGQDGVKVETVRLGVAPGNSQGGVPEISMTQATAGAAMVLGALLVAYATKKWVMGKKAEGKAPTAGAVAVGAAGGARPLMQAGIDVELVRDMRELSERLAVELDAKAERLERLIEAADERMRRLEGVERSEARVVEVKPEFRRGARSEGGYEVTHRDVYELADAGMTVIEIAKKLERPTGQVELILNLRKGTVAL